MPLDELRTLLDRHARPDWTTAVDGVLISKVDRAEPPAPATSGTVLAVIAQGGKRLALGERVYEYGPGQYLVASVDLPVTGQFRQVDEFRPAAGPAPYATVAKRATDDGFGGQGPLTGESDAAEAVWPGSWAEPPQEP